MRFKLLLFLLLSVYLLPSIALSDQSIKVLGLFRDKALVAVDGKQKVIKIGQEFQGVTLLAADSETATLLIYGKNHTFRLGALGSSQFKKPQSSSFTIKADERGMYTSSGSINGRLVDFIVDTGATYIAMNEQMAASLGIRATTNSQIIRTATASGIVNARLVTLNTIKVGSITIRNIEAVIMPGEHPQIILFGMSFLSQLKMTNNGQIMTLDKRF